MDIFREDCELSADKYDAKFDVKFAPIRRLSSDERVAGKWGFAYTNEEREYENGTYRLGSNGGEIHFVSSMSATKTDTRPTYIWHVISIPVRETDWNTQNITGYTARYNDFQNEQERWDDETYRQLRRSVVSTGSGRNLMFVDMTLGEDIQLRIRNAWKDVFQEAMDSLVIASGSVGGVYVHTFYYHGVLSSNSEINLKGDRRNSSKYVHLAGDVFGFVLDDKGRCIASASLKIVNG